jgi:hypothetical protein
MFLGFLLIEIDAWSVMLGPTGSLVYLATTGASLVQSLFMLCVLALLAAKHFGDLRTIPRPKARLITWLQSRRRET